MRKVAVAKNIYFQMVREEEKRQSSASSSIVQKSVAESSGQIAAIHQLKQDLFERNHLTIETSKTLFRDEVG